MFNFYYPWFENLTQDSSQIVFTETKEKLSLNRHSFFIKV